MKGWTEVPDDHTDRVTENLVRVLESRGEGLTVLELRRVLLDGYGMRPTPRAIEDHLRAYPGRFILGANGIWRLAEMPQSPEPGPDSSADNEEAPFCADLPDLGHYIAFDVETTGLDAENDRIFQIAAVRVQDGRPATQAFSNGVLFSEYINLEGHELPYSLRLKLGLVGHPEWQERLDNAAPLEEVVARFREWAGDWPLVAHNAAFDRGFLECAARRIGWDVINRFACTMELAVLTRPDLPHHRLEDLAQEFTVQDLVQGWLTEVDVDASLRDTFHNAVTDVFYLTAVFESLKESLRERARRFSEFRKSAWQLMPELCNTLELPAVGAQIGEASSRADATIASTEEPVACDDMPTILEPEAVEAWFKVQRDARNLRPREAQERMVREVARCLRDGGVMMVEAPTGTGKTFAYLAPCAVAARAGSGPIFISTYTRLLQDQLAGDAARLRDEW